MKKSTKSIAMMSAMCGLFPGVMDFLSDENIEKEIKKIKNQKPYKNRGIRIQPRVEPKVGRNEICPCNSGKKYKNCCIKK